LSIRRNRLQPLSEWSSKTEVAMNGAQHKAELQRLERVWTEQAATCRKTIELMRRGLPADQMIAVDTGRIEQAFDTHATAGASIALPSFAIRV
jgi:hypothetical protein